MEYGELVSKAEANLEAKGVLKNYASGEGSYLRQGAETNFVNSFNHQYFERFGFKFRMIDSQEATTEITLFNRKFKTPILSGALSGMVDIAEKPLAKIAAGVKDSGSMMWLGIVSSETLKEVLDTGAPTVRIVKPFQEIETMVRELKEAEEGGAIAVGTDIDFFYGGKRGDRVFAPKAMAPKSAAELKKLARVTKLPFILKGRAQRSRCQESPGNWSGRDRRIKPCGRGYRLRRPSVGSITGDKASNRGSDAHFC